MIYNEGWWLQQGDGTLWSCGFSYFLIRSQSKAALAEKMPNHFTGNGEPSIQGSRKIDFLYKRRHDIVDASWNMATIGHINLINLIKPSTISDQGPHKKKKKKKKKTHSWSSWHQERFLEGYHLQQHDEKDSQTVAWSQLCLSIIVLKFRGFLVKKCLSCLIKIRRLIWIPLSHLVTLAA